MLINKKNVKVRTLAVAKGRAHVYTRVSGDVYPWLDRLVGEAIERLVANMPSKGKTICVGR